MKMTSNNSVGLSLCGWVAVIAATSVAEAAWINEFHYDNEGADRGEFLEIAGAAGLDLGGWSLWFYNGSSGTNYGSLGLTGVLGDSGGGFGVAAFSPGFSIQNGPDALALVGPGDSVVQFLGYEGSFPALDGPALGQSPELLPVEESSSTPLGHSLQLVGTGERYGDFRWSLAADSPGLVNGGQILESAANSSRAEAVPDATSPALLLACVAAGLPLVERRLRAGGVQRRRMQP